MGKYFTYNGKQVGFVRKAIDDVVLVEEGWVSEVQNHFGKRSHDKLLAIPAQILKDGGFPLKDYHGRNLNKFGNLTLVAPRPNKIYSNNLSSNFISPNIPKNYMSSWAQYSVLLKRKKKRVKIVKTLTEKGIPSMIYYKIPLHLQKVFKYLGYKIGDLPKSENISNRILSLPMHPYLKRSDQDFIIDTLKLLSHD